MTAHIDFAALPDAEAARLMAEKDGWRVVQHADHRLVYEPSKNGRDWYYSSDCEYSINCLLLDVCGYPRSLDVAVGWLGRMGLMWSRVGGNKPYVAVYRETPDPNTQYCDESPTCPTTRALCNAGWAAVQAREASEA